MNWFVIYTKPKQELKVAKRLQLLGYNSYCPTVKVIRQWSDRKKKLTVPLINSYVFIYCAESQRKSIFEVPGVIRFVFSYGKPAIIKQNEIERLEKTVQGKIFNRVELSTWQQSQQVTIPEGVFEGQLARVQRTSKNRVYLVLESLGMFLTLEY